MNKLANSYKIVRHYVGRSNKFTIYYAYSYSKLLYGIELYGMAGKDLMRKLQVQQNRTLKILFQKHYRTHTKDLYAELNLLQIQNMRNSQVANLVFRQKHNILPAIFANYFTWGNEIHDHVTRNVDKIHVRQPYNDNGKKMMKYQGPHIWNKLPNSVTDAASLPTFKKKVKIYFLDIQKKS